MAKILGIRWANTRDILPDEARDFTPWLAENLGLLGEAIGLEELELISQEHAVENFRLDIRAVGSDALGEMGVVIENQYGRTNHDHLGKLITYAAQAEAEYERVLAVWVTETAQLAHLAAVEFLNRTSDGSIGWFLVRARFAPAPEGHYAFLEVLARPNEFLREGRPGRVSRDAPERSRFMHDLFERLSPRLSAAGYRKSWCHPGGWAIRAYLPAALGLNEWSELRVRCTRSELRLHLLVRNRRATDEAIDDVFSMMRARYEKPFAARLRPGTVVDWNAGAENRRSRNALVTLSGGYGSGDAPEAAEWVDQIASAWLMLLREDPLRDLPESSGGVAEDGDDDDELSSSVPTEI